MQQDEISPQIYAVDSLKARGFHVFHMWIPRAFVIIYETVKFWVNSNNEIVPRLSRSWYTKQNALRGSSQND